jgi:hypothetical protein
MRSEFKHFMMRLRPETRALLDQAARDQRRSRASIVDELVHQALRERYSTTETRLDKLLRSA